MRLALGCAAAALSVALVGVSAAAFPKVVPSYDQLTTGNGHGFSVFDAHERKLTTFLDHPYRYVSAGSDPHATGVPRRDLAWQAFFGARIDGKPARWLPDVPQSEVGHIEQSGVLHSVVQLGAARIESAFFAPFGLEQNALVLIATAANTGATPLTVELFAFPAFRLGDGDPDDPSPAGEHIVTRGARSTETGALGESGGALVYLPIGKVARADCSGDGYRAVLQGTLSTDQRSCDGSDRTLVYQSTPLVLAPGERRSFGVLVGFVDAASRADTLGDALQAWLGDREPEAMVPDALAEWARWRTRPPDGLSADERAVYRQAEATLRMAQVREPNEGPRRGHGMILASLPVGVWHMGWVRDAAYAIVALARMGHLAEAHDALRFFLDARAGEYARWAGGPYRISVTRYFGDGHEEADWNGAGPNIELDGWGLYLWALRQTLDASTDASFLDERLVSGERVLDAVREGVADPLVRARDASGLISPDTSIWESHWDNRKHYAYTQLAAARGLCDLGSLEARYGDRARATALAAEVVSLRRMIRGRLLDRAHVLAGSEEMLPRGPYHDGAVFEAFNWEIFAPDDRLYPQTIAGLDAALRLPSGGYERNDDGASSYDSNEWIFVDLRAAGAHRRMGQLAAAESLIGWVTAQGRANHDLLPELLNAFVDNGPLWSFTGSTPMVGFGAAAYVLALRDRHETEAHDCGVAEARPVAGEGAADPAEQSDDPAASTPLSAGQLVGFGILAALLLGVALRTRSRMR